MNVRGKVRNFMAGVRTAGMGVALAFRKPKFTVSVVIMFVVFGTLMSLLSAGTAGIQMIFSGDVGLAINVVWKAFLGLFGVGMGLIDWLTIFCVSLLQAIVVGLVVFVWRGRKAKARNSANVKGGNADNVEKAGIAAGLAMLGSGCPTCGTTLLMPIVTATVGSGGMALASAISGVLTAGAVMILLFSIRSLGQEAYTLIIEEELTKKGEK